MSLTMRDQAWHEKAIRSMVRGKQLYQKQPPYFLRVRVDGAAAMLAAASALCALERQEGDVLVFRVFDSIAADSSASPTRDERVCAAAGCIERWLSAEVAALRRSIGQRIRWARETRGGSC